MTARIGTAGWAIPKAHAAAFPAPGSHLARYAQRLNAVEINTSFYRPHRSATYQRWSASVPADFAFSVKVPKTVTHEQRLAGCEAALDAFLEQTAGLGGKLQVLLVQLPPNLAFDARLAARFFATLRARAGKLIAFEPRHRTWFAAEADALLVEHEIARVAADPAIVPAAAEPGGWNGLAYFRLHGAPRTYYSDYGPDEIARHALLVRKALPHVWCIYDNTALGAATANALTLSGMLD